MPRVVLAPDKFKGTLTAAEVAKHLADGIRSRRLDVDLVVVPVADGGDGMLDAFEAAGFRRVPIDAADAIGAIQPSRFASGAGCRDRLAAVAGLARSVSRVPADRQAGASVR
jgi:glycerate kinase